MLDDLYRVKYKGGISLNLVHDSCSHFIKDLRCKLCEDLAWEVCLCLYCDTVYCNSCITRWLKRKKECLECKSEFVSQKLHNTMENILNEKVFLKCLYYNNGCDKFVKYKEFYLHLKKCKFTKSLSPTKSLRYNKSKESNRLTKSTDTDKFKMSKTISIKESNFSSTRAESYKLVNCSICKMSFNSEELNTHNDYSCVRKLNSINIEELKGKLSVNLEKISKLEQENCKLNEIYKNIHK